MNIAPVPHHAAGLVGRELDRVPRAGEITPQPVIYERLNGEQLRFASVASFYAWWSAQQRREIEAEEIVRPA